MQLNTETKITKTIIHKLAEAAGQQAGRRKVRTLSQGDVSRFIELLRKHRQSANRIRVYSADGFVPNSYTYRADIDYIEGHKDDAGVWHVHISSTGAQRPRGRGALATVDGRAAE